jgi:hypothetical protein
MKILVAAMGLLATTATSAVADPPWQVHREPGLICMTMPNRGVAIHSVPAQTSDVIGYADSTVFMPLPRRAGNGFVMIERPDREPGWVPEKGMQPKPNCTPMLMSNGAINEGN